MGRRLITILAVLMLIVLGSCSNNMLDLIQEKIAEDRISAPAIEGSGFASASIPGDSGILTLSESSETLIMIYANNSASITFPTETDDSSTATLTTEFYMGETEVTNAVFAAVYQWAYDNGKFSSTESDPNGLDTTTAKHGGQELINLDNDGSYADCHIKYSGGSFTVDSGYGNHPVTDVSWYGAVMFCNWLTEMRDGNTDNVVYTNIDNTWEDEETAEDVTKTGYRLPDSYEWEYAARYRGEDEMNTVSGYSSPYYTKGNSASGATADYNDISACRVVSIFDYTDPDPYAETQLVKIKSSNNLGLYDMSGNVWEWVFSGFSYYRIDLGGSWSQYAGSLQIGGGGSTYPSDESNSRGFRLCRTR